MTDSYPSGAPAQCRLVCPDCGETSLETMPTNACVYFWECGGCGVMLKPKDGDCCVFCSYGDQPCLRERRVARFREAVQSC
jgi:hypothetical protein